MSEHQVKGLVFSIALAMAVGAAIWDGMAAAKHINYDSRAAIALISLLLGVGTRLLTRKNGK